MIEIKNCVICGSFDDLMETYNIMGSGQTTVCLDCLATKIYDEQGKIRDLTLIDEFRKGEFQINEQ